MLYWTKKQDVQDRKRQDKQDRLIYPADHAGASPIISILFFVQYTERDSKIGKRQGGAPNLSQAKPTPGPQKNVAFFWDRPLQLNLHSPSDAGGLKGGGCPTQPEPIFESRAVYRELCESPTISWSGL